MLPSLYNICKTLDTNWKRDTKYVSVPQSDIDITRAIQWRIQDNHFIWFPAFTAHELRD